jgi:phosphate transport system permease protein
MNQEKCGQMDDAQSFTGRSRQRTTTVGVRVADTVSRGVITIGGIGTIAAVSTVAVFLVIVVLPLFRGASVEPQPSLSAPWGEASPVCVRVDEYQVMGYALSPEGVLRAFNLKDGTTLATRKLEHDARITAVSLHTASNDIAFGTDDGSVHLGTIEFETTFREAEDVPEALRKLKIGESAPLEEGMAEVTPIGQYRIQNLAVDLAKLKRIKGSKAIVGLAHYLGERDAVFAMLDADGKLTAIRADKKLSMMSGKMTYRPSKTLELPLPSDRGRPKWVLVSELGVDVYAVWEDGHLLRFNVRDVPEPQVAEEVDLVPEPDRTLTALSFLVRDTTLVVGDSAGTIRAWFPHRNAANQVDGRSLAMAHEFVLPSPASVTALNGSPRSRIFAAGFADGMVRLYFMTSEKLLAELVTKASTPVTNIVIAPKDNGLVACSPAGLWQYGFDPGHPEATTRSLFLKVWYEGLAEPTWKWQSSSGFKGYEMKLSLIPLILGTVKATFYSMLFGAPIALCAAIYTSEFLDRKARLKVKPVIELMASLPSVILGFVAALVFAPVIEDIVCETMTGVFTVPLALLAGAYCWQMLPRKFTLRWSRLRLLFVAPALAVGVWAAAAAGPLVERWLLNGDIRDWLHDPSQGTGLGAWMFLLLPLCAVGMALLSSRTAGSWLRREGADWPRRRLAAADATRFLVTVVVTLLVTWLLASLLTTEIRLGETVLKGTWDPRQGWDAGGINLSPFGTYVQRNALVVGLIMGFAIIPIIYTIAEDALSAVPDHLRSASLGAGATPWQTAVRIVVPTAMSGLFSALMIGLGRAVGETMIVLMAAGNTPVLQMNLFNGFRTLSANIATELPEAVRDSTHYRTLFLAALTLFVMTFFINTAAEAVRLRFRKKALEL